MVGSAEKIRAELGWQPRGSFTDLVREMVEAELAAVVEKGKEYAENLGQQVKDFAALNN